MKKQKLLYPKLLKPSRIGTLFFAVIMGTLLAGCNNVQQDHTSTAEPLSLDKEPAPETDAKEEIPSVPPPLSTTVAEQGIAPDEKISATETRSPTPSNTRKELAKVPVTPPAAEISKANESLTNAVARAKELSPKELKAAKEEAKRAEKIRLEAEEKRIEAEKKAQKAEAKAQKEAQERADKEEEARREALEKAQRAAAKAKEEAEELAKKEERARLKAEAKAKKEAQERAEKEEEERLEALEKAQKAELKAQKEAEERAQKEERARLKAEEKARKAEAKAQKEALERAKKAEEERLEAAEKARKAALKAQKEVEELAAKEAKEQAAIEKAAHEKEAREAEAKRELENWNATAKIESPTIKPGHILNIIVLASGETEIETSKRVSTLATVTLPLIGNVKVAGLTAEDLKDLLETKYLEYVREPMVDVAFALDENPDSVSPWGWVTVMGKVKNPGRVNIPPTQNLSLSMAIQSAGGLDKSAKQTEIIITRIAEDGEKKKLKLNLKSAASKGQLQNDIHLKPNDVVYVPERIF